MKLTIGFDRGGAPRRKRIYRRLPVAVPTPIKRSKEKRHQALTPYEQACRAVDEFEWDALERTQLERQHDPAA